MSLQHIRQKIDNLDTQIVQLINERLSWALCTAPHKKEVEDAEREGKIIERLSRFSSAGLSGPSLSGIYREIFQLSRTAQRVAEAPMLTLGGSGGFSEAIGRQQFSDRQLILLPDAKEFFRLLGSPPGQEGLLNLDNLSGRTLDQLWTHLLTGTLSVKTVLTGPFPRCAIMVPGEVDHRNLREVWTTTGIYTTYQPHFERLNLRPRLFVCEGLAARKLLGSSGRSAAFAGSISCAELFSLEIIRELPAPQEASKVLFLQLGAPSEAPESGGSRFRWNRSNRSAAPIIWQRQFPAHQFCLDDSDGPDAPDSLAFRSAFRKVQP